MCYISNAIFEINTLERILRKYLFSLNQYLFSDLTKLNCEQRVIMAMVTLLFFEKGTRA